MGWDGMAGPVSISKQAQFVAIPAAWPTCAHPLNIVPQRIVMTICGIVDMLRPLLTYGLLTLTVTGLTLFNMMTWYFVWWRNAHLQFYKEVLKLAFWPTDFFVINAIIFSLFGCIYINPEMYRLFRVSFFLPLNLISLFTQAHCKSCKWAFFVGISQV